MKRVSIVIVNWNGYDDTIRCLESIRKVSYPVYDIVVIDNGSSDDSEIRLRECYPQQVVLQTGSNLGFAGGANVGIRYAISHGADYVALINNDTEVSNDFLGILVDAAESEATVGIASGKIYFFNDTAKLWSYGGSFDANNGTAVHFHDDGRFMETRKRSVYLYAQGCLMLIKKECFEHIGLFSEKYFHLGEDVEFCIRAQKMGWKIAFAPNAIIYHKVSSSMKGLSPTYNYYEQRNRLFIIKEYHDYRNLFDQICNILMITLRIMFTAVFITDNKGRLTNIRLISAGVYDFFKNRSGKRF